jgi:hypothetical protein
MKAHLVALVLLLSAVTIMPGEGPRTVPPASHAPTFDHIFVILEENMDSSQIVGNAAAPFINDVLIKRNFWYPNYFGLNHGSLPDYLGLISGSEHRDLIGDPPTDCTPAWAQARPTCAITSPRPSNIADTIEASGRSWRAYVQTMGQPCRWQTSDPVYDVTHNPFVYFATVEGGSAVSSARCRQNDVDLSVDATHSLAADLASSSTTPNFVFIVPDNVHNMHDGNIAGGDRYLQDLFTGSNHSGQNALNPVNIFGSQAWKNERSIAYVVWDEDSGTFRNQVAAIAVGSGVNGPEGRDGTSFNHYSLLRTWENAWGLSPIGQGDAAASPMLGAFSLYQSSNSDTLQRPWRVSLAEGHPEVYARIEVDIRSRGSTVPLLSMAGSNGETRVQLSLDASRHLRMETGGGAASTTAMSLAEGWHSLQLHYRATGAGTGCEVYYDGRLVQDLREGGGYAIGGSAVAALVVGGAGSGLMGGDVVRNVVVATSPI